MDKNKSHIITVEDDGVITLPQDIIESLGWEEGDSLEFSIDDYSDAIYIRKVD